MIKNKSFLSFDGSKICYTTVGFGKKKVFLVHGLLTDRKSWITVFLPLIHKYTFILMENRGFGSSTNESLTNLNIHKDMGHDLHLLSKIVLRENEKAIVAGASMGNAIIWNMTVNFGDEWVEKYICVDHSLALGLPGIEESKVFLKNSDEFWANGNEVSDYVRQNPEYCRSIRLSKAPKHIREKATRAHELVVVKSVLSTTMLSPITNALPKIANVISMIFTDINRTWAGQFVGGRSYDAFRDYRETVKKIQKPMIFFCGKKSMVFDYDWQIKLINENKPGSKVYTFNNSGHDLMQSEMLKFYFCFKEALES